MPNKFVVFSQFTKYLDRVSVAVSGAGYSIARLDGSTSAAKRKKALYTFANDPTVKHCTSFSCKRIAWCQSRVSRVHQPRWFKNSPRCSG